MLARIYNKFCVDNFVNVMYYISIKIISEYMM